MDLWLIYELICEDIAHKTFIDKFLDSFSEKESFISNENFYKRFRASTKRDVLKTAPTISYNAFDKYQLDLLFIGIDYDDLDKNNFSVELENRYNEVDKSVKDKTLIFYPVQAIEHWLWYIKYHIENPKLTKNIPFENKKRKEAKFEIYKSRRASESKTIKIISELLKDADFKWLISRSESFKYFFNAFSKYLSSLKKG